MTRLSLLAATALFLAGCSHTVQTTSGAEYLSKYSTVESEPVFNVSSTFTAPSDKTDVRIVSVEKSDYRIKAVSETELIRQAASVEPLLTFPARFGLARIEDGKLTTIPEDEAVAWSRMSRSFNGLGSFTPVDPIIVQFTSNSLPPTASQVYVNYDGEHRFHAHDLLSKVRLGAARQHLDAVLIYEVGMGEKSDRRPLTAIKLKALGTTILSDRTLDAAGAAKAILLDVRNGYPYGTAQIEKDLSDHYKPWYSNNTRKVSREVARKSIAAALVPEVRDMFRSLVNGLRANHWRAAKR